MKNVFDAKMISTAAEEVGRWFRSIYWLLNYASSIGAHRPATLILLSLIASSAQAATVAAIYAYVSIFELGAVGDFGWVKEDWFRGQLGLGLFIVLLCALLVINYLAEFSIKFEALTVMRQTEVELAQTTLLAGSQPPNIFIKEGRGATDSATLLKLMSRNARYCGMTLRLLILAIPNGVTLSGAVVILLYLDWMLTFSLAAASVVTILLQYPYNRKGASATRRWDDARPIALRAMSNAINAIRFGEQAPRKQAYTSSYDLRDERAVLNVVEAYSDRILAIELAALTAQFSTVMIIALVLTIVGVRALAGDAQWSFFLSYAAALRIAATNFVGLSRSVASIARLYPPVLDLVSFLTRVKPIRLEKNARDFDESPIARPARLMLEEDHSLPPTCVNGLVALVALDTKERARPEFVVADSIVWSREATGPVAHTSLYTMSSSQDHVRHGAVLRIAQGRLISSFALRDSLALSQRAITDGWRDATAILSRDLDSLPRCYEEKLKSLDLNAPGAVLMDDQFMELLAQLNAAITWRASVIILEQAALKIMILEIPATELLTFLQKLFHVVIWYEIGDLEVTAGIPNFEEQDLIVTHENRIVTVLSKDDLSKAEKLNKIISDVTGSKKLASNLGGGGLLMDSDIE